MVREFVDVKRLVVWLSIWSVRSIFEAEGDIKKVNLVQAGFHRYPQPFFFETGLNQVDFLDVTLRLKDGSYRPYRKPNDKPLYINKLSNHPPTILKNLPSMIENRLNNISSCKDTFNQAKGEYKEALKESGHHEELKYKRISLDDTVKKRKRKRRRKIIWYNPPFNLTVTTDIGKKFFALLDHHFRPQHRLHKIINRN